MTRVKTPTRQRRPKEEVARLGREIYKQTILPQVEVDHHGEIVAIDVDSGEWGIAETASAAVKRLQERRPDAVDILCERVGYKALRSFGGARLGRPE